MSAVPEPTEHDPSAIVQTMQILTDIEEDLTDTAIAVAAAEVPSFIDTQTDLLQAAEAMESTLEQSIPAAPGQHEGEAQVETKDVRPEDLIRSEAGRTSAEPQRPEAAVTAAPAEELSSSTDDDASSIAHDASHAIGVVNSDNFIPVLPSEVVPPAHDVSLDTVVEKATRPTTVDAIPPSEENVAQAAANGEKPMDGITETVTPTVVETPSEISAIPPANGASNIIPPGPEGVDSSSVPLPTQTPFHPDPSAGEASLPDGLTDASPSVVSNRDIVRVWRGDPSNSNNVLALFNWSIQKTEIVDARAWYAALAEENPTATQPLLALINLELALSNFPQVEALFALALNGPSGGITAAADVSIWKAYLHYIRRQNPVTDGAPNADQIRSVVTNAYEFALKQCGTDRESGEIWQEYTDFINEASPKNTWETQQQMDTLRKVYQRAVCIPLNNVESIWKAYDGFESGLNKLTAKKFLAERSPAYMTARTALRELRALTDVLPKQILPPKPSFSDQDRKIINAWKAYLKWEESNPLVIEDQAVLATRVGYAFRKCLAEMRHFPELWHQAAIFYNKSGKNDEAVEVLKAGVQANPRSVLLTFALAELQEERKTFSSARDCFEALLTHLAKEVEDLKAKVEVEVNAARGPEIPAPAVVLDDDMNGAGEATKLIEEREARGQLVAERLGKEVSEVEIAMGVTWVMYMRFARRSEGIKMARAIFGKARKSPHVTWHIFEASAMMEYHTNKDSAVAIRIFELGFKLFSEEVDYVIRYLQFLLSINDDTNARALFERSALKIPADKARPLWDAWAKYEYMYGDLGAVQKLETRFAEVFPNDSPLKRFAQRFTYNGIDEIAIRDLGFGRIARPAQPPPPPTFAPASASPTVKRPAPESPHRRPASVERSHSPTRTDQHGPPKRYRQASPPRRYPDRPPPSNFGARDSRERSPMPPPGGMVRPNPILPAPVPMPPPQQVLPRDQLDRSGVTKPLAWFIGLLPTARSFDGPIFRADDIVGLFSNIDRAGVGIPNNAPTRGGYPEADRRYGGPPAPLRRY